MRSPLLRLLVGAVRPALLLYPRDFRAAFGRDVAAVHADLCLDRRLAGGSLALARHGCGSLMRICRAGLAERFGRDLPRHRHPAPSPRRQLPPLRGHLMNGMLHDVRSAARTLLKRPAFTALVVGMLGAGIAANVAIFSLFNGLFLRPLPYEAPQRLVDLDETAPRWNLEFVGISYPDFHAWNEQNRSFEAMAVYDDLTYNLSTADSAERVVGVATSWQLARVLGVEPILGRDFASQDDVEGAPRVALLSFATWRDRFGSDPEILGSTIKLDGQEYSLIGVLPAHAVLLDTQAELWVPLTTIGFCCDATEGAGSWWLSGVGRLADGVTIEQARDDLNRIHAGLIEPLGGSREVATPRLEPLIERYLGDTRPVLFILLGAVAILLLIACANVGGLLVARGAERTQEIAVRLALGAARRRVIRQLMTESALLALLGGLVGVALGYAGFRRLVTLLPGDIATWPWIYSTDWRFAAFAVAVSAAAALIFGFAPAMRLTGPDAGRALAEGARGMASRSRRRALNTLVVAEIGLAVVLLVAAGLLVRTFLSLYDVDPGFRDDALTFRAALPEAGYEEREARLAFFEELLDRVTALPGAEAAGLTTEVPMGGHSGWFWEIEGAPEPGPDDENPVVLTRFTSASYFDAIGIEFLRGAPFGAHDGGPDGPHTVVVNETFARHFWGDLDVIGERARTGGDHAPWLTVTGVTRDTRHYGLDEPMRPGVFVPYRSALGNRNSMAVVVRGDTEPSSFAAPARAIVQEIDREVPLYGVATTAERLAASTAPRRAYSLLLGAFAAVALTLALAGIYSTVSYAVSQRRREIGIRMALGARDAQVLRQVLREGMRTAGLGIGLGLALAFAVAGSMSVVLLGVSPRDPSVYVAAAALLAVTALLANVLPARRAAGTNPAKALQVD